ncbi:hypothetical protein [Saccharothrix sp. ST-888]|uniref:hypothetical protein n=1 Tax=Saccharothrix sp. ST-888 TaxID=1427391 RepID=UPI0005EC0DB7|nr:hypothetical protein [Saccharothrix sp. ST-888]KJK56110.1 hypothetical protein UK12_24530 [Saccharothrix sp. ST-888]
MSDGALPVEYHNRRGYIHLTLTNEPDRRTSEVGKVHLDSDLTSLCIGTVFFDQVKEKYWGTVRHTNRTIDATKPHDDPFQALKAVGHLYLIGSLGEEHPIIAAAYEHARKRQDERHRVHAQVPDGKNAHQFKKVQQADAAEQEAMDMLAVVLDAAGYDMAGPGGWPSADLARPQLDRWIDRQEKDALRRAVGLG